jgi:hypothetical protein
VRLPNFFRISEAFTKDFSGSRGLVSDRKRLSTLGMERNTHNMKCPRCGLLNPETAKRCDCGYDFELRIFVNEVMTGGESKAKLPRMWVGYLIAAIVFVAELNGGAAIQDPTAAFWYYTLFTVAGWFYWLYCVYRFHDILTVIPGYEHPILPERAVGMHFLPLYNFYWAFKWPSEIASFVNWRTQAKSMDGGVAGVLVLLSVLVGRTADAAVELVLLFSSGVYISWHLHKAFAAAPVPASAMAAPGPRSVLGL